MQPFLLWTLIAITTVFTTTDSSRILFLLPIASKSHKNVFDPLISALLKRGHELTIISPIKSFENVENLTEITPVRVEDIAGSRMMSGGNMFENRKNKGKLGVLLGFDSSEIDQFCHTFYSHEEIQDMIKTRPTFDVAFVNAILNQCALGLAHYLKVPHIYLGTLPLPNAHVGSTGNFFPRSFIASAFSPYIEKMDFQERVMNFIIELLSGNKYYQGNSAEIYRKYLGSEMPSVEEIDKGVSMIFMNTNFLLTFPRPLLPDFVEVGGMHCREANPLPEDLDELLGKAKDGFIYFSLGSIIRTKNMPTEVRKKFLNVFSRLKQLVIWKWDNENETDLPENVVVRKWLPQQDILGHSNIKLFITHGGLLSTQETIYHGVPLLGVPFYVDQDLNMKQAENLGFALTLEITDFTEESLENKINQIIYNSRFAQSAKELSKIFKDQPQTPIERAVYWTEYVIRYKGAPHLRSAARQLNTIQYFSIDVIAFLLTICLLCILILKIICIRAFQYIMFITRREKLKIN